MNDIEKLKAPFSEEEIEWRVDRSQKIGDKTYVYVLAYVSNRAIQNRLDEVFGTFGWKNEFKEWKGTSQLCGISVKHCDEWITKWDGSDDSNMDPVKGGISASMKRAAVQWGIGRYLYKLEQKKVPLNDRGDNYANVKVKVNGKDEYVKGYWDTPLLPDWALPESKQKITLANQKYLYILASAKGKTEEEVKTVLAKYNIKSAKELTVKQYEEVIERLKKLPNIEKNKEEVKNEQSNIDGKISA